MLPSLGLLVASALSYAPSSLLHRATTTARTPFIIAQQQPYRSDDKWDYFRLLRKVEVTLTKPLGAVLEETGQTAGTVKVDDLAEGGSALETGLLKKGDVLLTVMGEDVSAASFDDVMDLLINAPEEVELSVRRTMISRKPRDLTPLTLTVDGKPLVVEVRSPLSAPHSFLIPPSCPSLFVSLGSCVYTCMLLALIAQRGAVLRTAIQKGGMEVHKGMKAKINSCGGGGQCSSCWVEVLEGDDKLSPKTDAERARGKKKPESYRMACQALVQGECNVIVRSMEKVQ